MFNQLCGFRYLWMLAERSLKHVGIQKKGDYREHRVWMLIKIFNGLMHFCTNSRLWMFPLSSLSSAEKILGEITGTKVEVIP